MTKIELTGICCDYHSSHLYGCAQAPPAIRRALHSGAANLTAENGICLDGILHGSKDHFITEPADFMAIEQIAAECLRPQSIPLFLGGDHAITYPLVRALSRHYGPLSILHFDAHPDLHDRLEGNHLSHACPFARIMEEGLAKRLLQIGIRTVNAHQAEQAERFGVEMYQMNDLHLLPSRLDLPPPLYISFDMDVLDPAFAPGVSHHEPGGMSVREVLRLLAAISCPVVGADIVEYNPLRDLNDMTAMVAAKLVKEIAGRIRENNLSAAGDEAP